MIKVDVHNRVVAEAEFMIKNGATIRKTASEFGISKSTVYRDMTKILEGVNRGLYSKVLVVMSVNKSERHIRGGEANRRKAL